MKKNFIGFGLALLVALVAGHAMAIQVVAHEQYGVEQMYEGVASDISSHTVTGFGLSYSVYAASGTVDFQVKHSTSQDMNNLVVSSTIHVLAGQPFNNRFEGIVVNPLILISRIDQPGTTVYVDIQYLAPRGLGNQ